MNALIDVAIVDVIVLSLFGTAAFAIARWDQTQNDRDQAIGWILGGSCTLLIIGVSMYDRDGVMVIKALGTAAAMGLLPLGARLLYREGIDTVDAIIAAFTGFVLGATSWTTAWKAILAAAAFTGLFATVDLLRKDDTEARVSFSYVLAAVGFVSATAGVLGAL